jgi:3-hydroxy-D-aspartate aldolase
MDRYRPAVGTPIEELDTPCLIVDLDAVENNYRAVADRYRGKVCQMRQHTKNIKSPTLARMQIRAGGAHDGVCTAKLSEAEVMVEHGITDVLIPNQVVTADKIARLSALQRQGDVKVCIDNEQNVRDLSAIAEAHGVKIGVLIEVDTSMGRAGVRNPEQGAELAKLAESLPGVTFRGVMSHQHLEDFVDTESRILTARQYIQRCLDVKDAIEAEGIPVEIVSSGETFSYDAAADLPGVTEVEGGTYALMGTSYGYMKEFQIANKVLSTIVSTSGPGIAIGDAGLRALSWPSGPPTVKGLPGVMVDSLHAEHAVLRSDGTTAVEVGQQFMLLPWYQDMMVNRWDQYIAVREGVVEDVWDIPARGCAH